MLFRYHYVDHSIERFQEYLDHLVKEVWCKAAGSFSMDLLHPELKIIVQAASFTKKGVSRKRIKNCLFTQIQNIFNLFRSLDTTDRRKIATWYDNNNNIEALCACDPDKPPATYVEIRAINAPLEVALKEFCESLFTDVIHLKVVTSLIGAIEEHSAKFSEANLEEKCPYCGYVDIKGSNYTTREAYDHFLPKSIYPFNSVNFRNLAPMCHDCNSSYKLAKDPTKPKPIDPINRKVDGTRRRAFYSYSAEAPQIAIIVSFKTKDITNLKRTDIELEFLCPGHEDEVEAWKDVFGVEERYKAKICAKNDGKVWLQRVAEEGENYGLTKEQLFSKEVRFAQNYPYNDAGFLRGPFLIACRDAGLLS